ncbi:MAG TPA: glycosyltransferase family 2 protein [Candidatus Bathyarchaeia archaeon]|jgi:glycosyltransferase involved in cell wall biosynthesis|nr:glycosyltransferase family 2 protein [Candidatus Bathyarchaeia archaeon]
MNESLQPVASKEKVALGVLILTRNEEKNIGECLRSVAWAPEIFVVDSESTDRTREIAGSLGAQVCVHPFDGYAKQRNWALDHLPFSNEWVLMLDADERVPSALAAEIAEVLQSDAKSNAGFYISRRLIFLGRWLGHGGLFPTWILRLFKRHHIRFEERPLNEHAILNGTAGRLQHPFDHFDNRPLSDWIAKHNLYSDLETEEYLQERFGRGFQSAIGPRLWGSQGERKRWIKLRLWNQCPLLLRPFLFFFRNYFLKGGFLDGRPGLVYHVLWSFWYQFLISAKIIERQAVAKSGRSREPARLEALDDCRFDR